MIKIENLTKYYPGSKVPAIKDVTFHIGKGEIVGLLGENGAGKTTTLRILATTLSPTSGSASLEGISITADPAAARSRTGTFFGGETGLYDRLTGRENILYFARLNGTPTGIAEERLGKISRELGMEEYLHRRTHQFSRGMKQKTAIARSIIHDPAVMLFDEPTSGLDLRSSVTVFDFMRRCRDEGRTILFSSHNIYEVKKLSDRILIIHQGRMADKETVNGIFSLEQGEFEKEYLKIIGYENRDH